MGKRERMKKVICQFCNHLMATGENNERIRMEKTKG